MDSAATTKPLESVCDVVSRSICGDWYNPSSKYNSAKDVKKKIEEARFCIAESIGAKPDEIYFTSGGSESNSMALNNYNRTGASPILISNVEHESILQYAKRIYPCDPSRWLMIDVNKDGIIEPEQLDKRLRRNFVSLVSIQFVNNETGVVQDIGSLAEIAHKHYCHFHTDAVQAFPHMNCNVNDLGVDLMSISGHKFGAPKGIGVLYVKNKRIYKPIIYGTQERGFRGGTENTPYILGLAKAIQERSVNMNKWSDYIKMNRLYFEQELKKIGCRINCESSDRAPGIISCMLPENVVAEYIIYRLAEENIFVSAGSACHSNSDKPSHVLKAIGLTNDEISRTIRISLSEDIQKWMIDHVVGRIKCLINEVTI